MSFTSWLRNLRSAPAPAWGHDKRGRQGRKRAATHRPNLEVLEDRCVPALYAVTDLGMLYATDLNEAGQVVGFAAIANGDSRAVLWDNGTMIDLGTLGGNHSWADGINDLGQVVGTTKLPGDDATHAFLVTPQGGVWFQDKDLDGRNDFMIDLGDFNAADINNAGQVVGNSGGRAFLWDTVNGMVDLGVPLGFTSCAATAINEAGQVTGFAWSAFGDSAFLWDAASGMTVLSAVPGNSHAADISDAGQVIGDQQSFGFLWTPDSPNGLSGSSTGLGTLPGDSISYPFGMNNAGQVVGTSQLVESVYVCETYCDDYSCYEYCYYQDYYYPHAFFWDAAGGMVDLQTQLLPGSNVTLQYAEAINDGGVIVVNGYNGLGQNNAFLLTPIPPGTPSSISIADAPAVMEGNAGTVAAVFSVSLSAASTATVTVAYTTGNGSATAGSDYQAASGTLTFAPGETSKTITVFVNGDRLGEANENFFVNLSSPMNATIADGWAVGTIVDDEPRISISDVTMKEGNTGAASATFKVTLSRAYDEDLIIPYSTANGSATAGSDYTAASGSVIIAAGQTSNTFTVLVSGDRLPEANEAFFVNLSNTTNAVIVDGQGVATILDDEPRISISDVTKREGRKNTTSFVFTVTLSAAYDQPVTMSFQTVNGTATTSDNDYVAKTGTLTFAPGETTKTITIEVKGDTKKETNETFYLDLFDLSTNAQFTKNRGIGTILNDD
jgi:probable HAF family extracellular repeat protein